MAGSKSGSGKGKMPPSPHTSKEVRRIASEGLQRPSALKAQEVRTLAASAMAHIEPRAPGKGGKGR